MRLSFFIAILIGLAGCKSYMIDKSSNKNPINVTEFQQYMLNEINLARTKPSEYAELRLKTDQEQSTDNGSYQYLKDLIPVGVLSFNNSLNQSATKYAVLLAERNLFEHHADGNPLTRAIRQGFKGTLVGENIAAGSESIYNATLNSRSAAIGFVKMLMIDEGIENAGHRLNMLNSQFKTIGIGFGRDTTGTYKNYVVQDFGNL